MSAFKNLLGTVLILLISSGFVFSQRSGIVTGKLIDGTINEPMAFANVYVKGTSIGTVSDAEGKFRLDNVPAGDQVIVFSFIGFADQEIPVSIVSGEMLEIEPVTMIAESIMGEEVIVTAQMRGQVAAINQQVNSNTIVNVVSKDKIEEIPDVNAAESISRLPGITIGRSGGEGSQVTVRGVSPRFNSITVNGLRIPATATENRSVDLSMVSSDILQGIEVYKALTPDMDGDAMGGTVNLVTKTAEPGFHGRVQLESGYHGLIKDIGTYKGSLTLSNRFFDNKVGLLGTITAHRANRNSDEFDAGYEVQDMDTAGNPLPITGKIFLENHIETRDRLNASFTADYKMKTGQIVFDYFFTKTNRDILKRDIELWPDRSSIEYGMNKRENNLSLNSFQIRGDNDFKRILLNYTFSYSQVMNETPVSYGSGATEEGAFASGLPVYAKPQEIPGFGKYDLDNTTGGSGFGFSDNTTTDRNLTGQIDLKIPLFATNWLNGYIKTGGKLRQKSRDREINSYSIYDGTDYFYAYIAEYPDVHRLDRVMYFDNFIDPDYVGYEFPMGSNYIMPYVFDPDRVKEHYEKFSGVDSLWWKNKNPAFDEYDALERIMAGYIMAEINIGGLMILPGIRYEQDYNEYDGTAGYILASRFQYQLRDTTGNRSLGTWLPMLHLKYTFLDGFSLRLAATKTLNRPNFMNLTPFERYGYEGKVITIHRGSLDLLLPTAWNYDGFINYYSRFGLFSAGAFYKKIENIDINISHRDYSGTPQDNPYYGNKVANPINSKEPTTVWGAEFEVQTNFRWLPKPFDGIVLTANYSIVRSETYYPFFPIEYPPPDYRPVIIDTFRINRLHGQADNIANLTIGYEKRGFSARVSMNFQGNKLTHSGGSEHLDEYSTDYMRWDAVITQKFAQRWMVICNLINFTNEPEKMYMWLPENPTQEKFYGWAVNLAVRYQF